MLKANKKDWKNAFIAGTVSGMGLAAFLWAVEKLTGYKVFVLLLNVDFMPVIGQIDWPVLMEILFHLIISWAIACIYSIYLRKRGGSRKPWMVAFTLAMGAGLSYFPLSILAVQAVPSAGDYAAVIYWFTGHLLYAVLLKMTAAETE